MVETLGILGMGHGIRWREGILEHSSVWKRWMLWGRLHVLSYLPTTVRCDQPEYHTSGAHVKFGR